MIEKNSNQEKNVSFVAKADNEIDLEQVAKTLLRKKYLIAKITCAAIIFSGLWAYTRKPIWQGQFEIVLASNVSQAGSLLQSEPGIANLIGSVGSNNQLKTEVEILESPSVLKPVFDFVKQQKRQQGLNVEEWRYADWFQENVSIKLVRGTSVLELAYRDTDRVMILPVIQKISEAYQAYSGRDRERGINQAMEYLNQQIKIYNIKSAKSLRDVQSFGIEHNLTSFSDFDTSFGSGLGNIDNRFDAFNSFRGGGNQISGGGYTGLTKPLSIESIRVAASDKIRSIDVQLEQLKRFDQNPETLLYIGRTIPELASQKLPQTLDNLDTRLAILRSKFTDQDDSVRRLLDKRRLLSEVFKQQIYGTLYAQRTAAQARLKAAERPKGVLIKYRELLRTSARDEMTLAKLESERQALGLEQARKEDPWELISTPTLLDKPVAPSKKRIVTIGLLAGLIAGCGAALLADRRTGLVYSQDELKSLLPCPLLKHLPAMSQDQWTDAADLIAAGPLAEVSENKAIALIPLGNIPSELLNAFGEELKRALNGRRLIVSTDLRETSRCATQLLVTSPGIVTRKQLSQFRQKLALQGTPLLGWVLLDPDLDLG